MRSCSRRRSFKTPSSTSFACRRQKRQYYEFKKSLSNRSLFTNEDEAAFKTTQQAYIHLYIYCRFTHTFTRANQQPRSFLQACITIHAFCLRVCMFAHVLVCLFAYIYAYLFIQIRASRRACYIAMAKNYNIELCFMSYS